MHLTCKFSVRYVAQALLSRPGTLYIPFLAPCLLAITPTTKLRLRLLTCQLSH